MLNKCDVYMLYKAQTWAETKSIEYVTGVLFKKAQLCVSFHTSVFCVRL